MAGSQKAPVGASICRSGRTTGRRCGVVQAKNVTVNYSGSTGLRGHPDQRLRRGGDSGGAYISGDQAQGVTSARTA